MIEGTKSGGRLTNRKLKAGLSPVLLPYLVRYPGIAVKQGTDVICRSTSAQKKKITTLIYEQ
jgi:hypothetical protein